MTNHAIDLEKSMGARQTINLPSIGDYKDVPVIEILVKPGDVVALDDPLLTLESDKATIEVPSPVAGVIVEIVVTVGATVSEGLPIVVIDTRDDAVIATPNATASAVEVPVQVAPPPPAAVPQPVAALTQAVVSTGTAHASPSVRSFARELGVDLSKVSPSGRKGRVMRDDVLGFVKQQMATPAGPSALPGGLPPAPTYDFAKYGEIERATLSRIQKISGSTLHRNWLTIPHVTNFDDADITDIEAFRVALNSEKRDPPVKLTMLSFMVKAVARALVLHPRFNASLDGEDLVLKKYVHIGVAVDTPKGLMVPVVRDCDRKGVLEIGAEIGALAEKARAGKLSPADMEGGCISISSLGGIGGTGFTPIINAPEIAIVGAARAQIQPRWDGTAFQPRLIMPLNLSWDHRVVDGVAAARFLGSISEVLGDLRRAVI